MEIETQDELLEIDPEDFYFEILSQEEIIHWFKLCGAVWIHDGNPESPHAELSSGLCSNAFFESQKVLEHPVVTEVLARQLDMKLKKALSLPRGQLCNPWVIGSAYAAITFSYEVARQFIATHGFVEKDCADPDGKRMLWRRRTIPKNSNVLQIEELITTSNTFKEVRRAVNEGNLEKIQFLPIIGTLIHRPPKLPADYGEYKVVSLVEKEVWAVKPEECHLCKAGSKRYRPKTHWKELTERK